METKNSIPSMPYCPNFINMDFMDIINYPSFKYINEIGELLFKDEYHLKIYLFAYRYYFASNELNYIYEQIQSKPSHQNIWLPTKDFETFRIFAEFFTTSKLEFYNEKGIGAKIWERFSTDRELDYKIKAYNLKKEELWFLLIFLYDYIEGLRITIPNYEPRSLLSCLPKTTSIILKNEDKKICEIKSPTIIALLKYLPLFLRDKAIDKNTKTLDYNFLPLLMLLDSTKESTGTSIGRTGKALLLDKYMIQFLKDKKAHNIQMYDNNHHPKGREAFISQLIYVLGYGDAIYNTAYTKGKSRPLNSLKRKYEAPTNTFSTLY